MAVPITPTYENISIHALLAESDHIHGFLRGLPKISIHALLAESDGGSGVGSWPRVIFLSTLSLRRATFSGSAWVQEFPISIHALLAESDLVNTYHRIFGEGISIHALLAESDKLQCILGRR